MLHEFLALHRDLLVERCRRKVMKRHVPEPTDAELQFGVPLFLDQLIGTLKRELAPPALSLPAVGLAEMANSAARHGRELLQHGFTVDQVVHDYGDLCQAITELAIETDAPIDTGEFRTLNRCLDDGIADAVTEYTRQRELASADRESQNLNERLGTLAHELRNHLNTAALALSVIRSGNVGVSGATGAVLDRSLAALRNLVDRSLADVRVSAGMPVRHELIFVAEFIADIRVAAVLEAKAHDCEFAVAIGNDQLAVHADRDMLVSAVSNLLQNAFKFTRPHTLVTLRAYAQGERVLIDVQDQCGGLPPGNVQDMFKPFKQVGLNRTGMGLSICKRSVEANAGKLSVRDLPGSGCIFCIDLPRHKPG